MGDGTRQAKIFPVLLSYQAECMLDLMVEVVRERRPCASKVYAYSKRHQLAGHRRIVVDALGAVAHELAATGVRRSESDLNDIRSRLSMRRALRRNRPSHLPAR